MHLERKCFAKTALRCVTSIPSHSHFGLEIMRWITRSNALPAIPSLTSTLKAIEVERSRSG